MTLSSWRSALLALTSFVFGTLALLLSAPAASVEAQSTSRGWRVWIREDPCPGRFDWLSVAKDPPAGGKNVYVPYETLLGNQGCTVSGPRGCTFEEATALMESLRSNDKFLDLCCHDYSVWENSETGKRSVVLGKQGNGGFGSRLVKGDLCCEQAEDLAGIPGACSGGKGTGKGGSGSGFGGKWSIKTDFGDLSVDLTQSGTHVSGSFVAPYLSGTLDGTITGGTLKFTWRGGEYTGSGQATMANDGRSFTGSWLDDLTKTNVQMRGTKSP